MHVASAGNRRFGRRSRLGLHNISVEKYERFQKCVTVCQDERSPSCTPYILSVQLWHPMTPLLEHYLAHIKELCPDDAPDSTKGMVYAEKRRFKACLKRLGEVLQIRDRDADTQWVKKLLQRMHSSHSSRAIVEHQGFHRSQPERTVFGLRRA